VNTERFNPRFRSEAYRRQFGLEPGDPLVTYVGRIAPEKNVGVLLDAWERLGSRRGSAHLVFVGQGLMERTIRERGLPNVHMIGMQRGDDLSTAYASADIFAFPSVTETFGNVLLEAMASGVAPVVAAAGGVLDFAHHGQNAWLTEPDNAGSFADGLARLLQNHALRQGLAEGARETGIHRQWATIYDRLLRDYAEAASRPVVYRAA